MTRTQRNRQNAQKSTGPRTPEGKFNASLSAFRDPVTRQVLMLANDDAHHFRQFTAKFVAELAPVGEQELQLARRIADCNWRMNAFRAMETHILTLAFHAGDGQILAENEQIHSALAVADGLRNKTFDISTISVHEQRICRQHAQAMKQLEDLQTQRRHHEKEEMHEAANLYQLHQEEHPEPNAPAYDPHEDGFVFTVAQIAFQISRKLRVRRANDSETRRIMTAKS